MTLRFNHQKGFSKAEILITLGLVGVVSALAVPVVLQSTQKNTDIQSNIDISNNLGHIFQAYQSEKGLIPKTVGPARVVIETLNASERTDISTTDIETAAAMPEGCPIQTAAKKLSLTPTLAVYVANDWQSTPAGDQSTLCIHNTDSAENAKLSTLLVKREGELMGAHSPGEGAIGNINSLATGPSTTSGTPTVSTEGPGAIVSPAAIASITPKFVSAYDANHKLTPASYSIDVTCDNGYSSSSNTSAISVEEGENCQYTVSAASSGNPKILLDYADATANKVANGDGTIELPLKDSYETILNLTFEANPQKTQINYSVANITGSELLNKKTLTFFLPRGSSQLNITGNSVAPINKALTINGPKTESLTIETKEKINILSTVAWWVGTSVSGQDNLSGFSQGHQDLAHFYGTETGIGYDWSHVTDRIHQDLIAFGREAIGPMIEKSITLRLSIFGITDIVNAFGLFVGAGLEDRVTGQKQLGLSQLIDGTTPFTASNGKDYYVNNQTGDIYAAGITNWTPVKVSLDKQNATLNSDDKFLFDPDGFTQKTTQVVTTPGGLNSQEAWLVLDRDNNGTWVNNTLDNDDVFGDHMGHYKNGYEDLDKTFAHEIQTDKDGKRYIALNANWWDIFKINFGRWMGDRTPYAVVDLKLLTRDRELTLASKHLKRIDVSYWDVKEEDHERSNAIFQRANVTFIDGTTAESADQYWRFTNGALQKLDKAESNAIYQEYLRSKKAKK